MNFNLHISDEDYVRITAGRKRVAGSLQRVDGDTFIFHPWQETERKRSKVLRTKHASCRICDDSIALSLRIKRAQAPNACNIIFDETDQAVDFITSTT